MLGPERQNNRGRPKKKIEADQKKQSRLTKKKQSRPKKNNRGRPKKIEADQKKSKPTKAFVFDRSPKKPF